MTWEPGGAPRARRRRPAAGRSGRHHVEEVQGDAVALRAAELLEVVARPQQAQLLAAPPGEADRGRGLVPASWRASSRTVAEPLALSFMPGPALTLSRWAPTITTRSPPPASSATTLLVGRRWDSTSTRTTPAGVVAGELAGHLLGDRQHRDRDPWTPERPGDHRGLARVVDDRRGRPGPLGVVGLDPERAGAALQHGDGAAREPGEVGRLAAAGRGGGARGEVDGPGRGGDVAVAREGEREEVLLGQEASGAPEAPAPAGSGCGPWWRRSAGPRAGSRPGGAGRRRSRPRPRSLRCPRPGCRRCGRPPPGGRRGGGGSPPP